MGVQRGFGGGLETLEFGLLVCRKTGRGGAALEEGGGGGEAGCGFGEAGEAGEAGGTREGAGEG